MNSNKPLLHVSIYYRGSSKFRTELRKHLSSYTKRLLSNPREPTVDICLDTFKAQEEKKVQQELIYPTVTTYRTKQKYTSTKGLYTFAVLLISLTMQRLYENNPNSKPEDWMIISIIPSNTDDQANTDYDIQWSVGQ